MPPSMSTSPVAMKSIEIERGGPVIPRSNSRATVRSPTSVASSRCPMPGGRTHASVSLSYSQAAVRSPRLELTAWWIGARICSSTNVAPTTASGVASESPRCTAPTSAPIAIAKTAGSTPRTTSETHHTVASAASARGSTLKNCHSFRRRSAAIIVGAPCAGTGAARPRPRDETSARSSTDRRSRRRTRRR